MKRAIARTNVELERAGIEAFDRALEWTLMGTGEALAADPRDRAAHGGSPRTAVQSRNPTVTEGSRQR
jgi:hypothetical protein